MPELPEVETVVRQLQKEITGKKITAVEILAAKSVRDEANKFIQETTGTKITAVERRAKLIILKLNNGQAILTHLKMTGKYILNASPHQHTRVVFHFGPKTLIAFNDLRRFGYLKLIEQNKLPEFLAKQYGPEPLETSFTTDEFLTAINQKPKAKIKPLLLDQKIIAGIGNIYAQEACFIAGIHPARLAGQITKPEAQKLLKAIKKILNDSIDCGGTTADDYLNVYGEKGSYVKKLLVYGRAKMPCLKCGAPLVMIKLGGRGTVYCPNCQK